MHRVTNNFDGLRLLGALLVIVSHQFALSGRWEPTTSEGIKLGSVGLAMFFAISGHLVLQSWRNDPHLMRFAARRFLRIWPAWAAVVAITTLAYLLASEHTRPYASQYWKNLLGLRFYDFPAFSENPMHDTNGPMWTITKEIRCYVLLVALALVSRRYLQGALVATAVGLGVLAIALHLTVFMDLLAFFVGGAIAGSVPRSIRALAASVGLLCLAAGFQQTAFHLLAPAACIEIGTRSWPALRSAGRFGDLSYGMYLWGWPVQQLGVLWLGRETPYLVLLSVTIACAGAIAWLSWHLIEKTAMRLKPRNPIQKRTAATNLAQESPSQATVHPGV
jgi:peptidoglycan/LPS O-acetylase OafA/YrhL